MSNPRSTADMQTALARHVARFCHENGDFSPTTVQEGLDTIHGTATKAKGVAIATFNASHCSGSVWPHTHGKFEKRANTQYGDFLHMGTARIWDADGTINEERWDRFSQFVTAGQQPDAEKIVLLSKLKEYLAKCYNEDAPDNATGRNANAWFSSKYVQGTAATTAWDEVFNRLACGWTPLENNQHDFEPYMTLELVREFFESSMTAFQKAEAGELPVAKPTAHAQTLEM